MSNKINELSKNMGMYLDISEQIKESERCLREKKKYKHSLEKTIVSFIESNHLAHREFTLKQFKLKYETASKKTDLTQKLIKHSLLQYFRTTYHNKLSDYRCEEKANEIFQYILNQRDTKEISSLKYSPL
jgi:hypothetical protein